MLESISESQQAVLNIIDEQIAQINRKLKKAGVDQMIADRSKLLKTKATLLNELTANGRVSNNTKLTMEQVVHAFKELGKPKLSVQEIAEKTGVEESVVRSHLNRNRDVRYAKRGSDWKLVEVEETNEDD